MRAFALSIPMFLLSACSEIPANEDTDVEQSPEVVEQRTCELLTDEVINLSKDKPVSLIKIYEPVELNRNDREISCSGTVVSSAGSERLPIFFRQFSDEDGESFIEYSGEPFAKSAVK